MAQYESHETKRANKTRKCKMTVQELIKKLEILPPDAKVWAVLTSYDGTSIASIGFAIAEKEAERCHNIH